MAVPIGFHWYSWHQNPFDNDYPHYFPAKEGFGEAVRGLAGQRGIRHALYQRPLVGHARQGHGGFPVHRRGPPAATKDEAGKPYVEIYGSKESDGSPVRLAVMCPATELWQAKVRQTVLRLMKEYGMKGVYIDQIAAAQPELCFDPSHGHPDRRRPLVDRFLQLDGGGHSQGETGRLHADHRVQRRTVREGFDGYLTWHWCCDGQVPAFPAVYGGAIQMFGRAYRGGPRQTLPCG